MFFRGEVDFDQEPRGDQVMTREGPFWALTTRKAYLLTTDIMCEAKLNAHGAALTTATRSFCHLRNLTIL